MKVNCMIAAVVVFAVFCFAVNDVRAHMHDMMKYASVKSPNGKFELKWTYNNDTGMLYFKMKCQGTGWCGVGFAVNGDGRRMASYDVAIGGYNGTAGYLWVSFPTTSFILLFHASFNFFLFLYLVRLLFYILVLFKKV